MATTKELTWGVTELILRAFGASSTEVDYIHREVSQFNDTQFGDDVCVKARARGEQVVYFVRVKDNTWFPDGVGPRPTAG
jgi:hypothetical protein